MVLAGNNRPAGGDHTSNQQNQALLSINKALVHTKLIGEVTRSRSLHPTIDKSRRLVQTNTGTSGDGVGIVQVKLGEVRKR